MRVLKKFENLISREIKMKKYFLIFMAFFLVFSLSFGCSKKKKPVEPNKTSQTTWLQTKTVDVNSKTDVNTSMLNRAIQKTTSSQTGERRPRDYNS